ncbi:S1 RNA-binding domain-containing protein, partial [bacterium]|nr:S1 RNA-binding domain-containing protein [bacterium]
VSRRKVLEHEQGQRLSEAGDQMKEGDRVNVKVVRLESFGAFVEISPGVEGMIHVSELSWSRVSNPADVLEMGQSVAAKIIKIEQGDRRLKIALSIKQLEGSPWENLPSHVQVGQVIEGTVTRCAPFGAFVEIIPGVEGLVPLSQMSSSKRANSAEEFVKVGEKIAVLVKELSLETKRATLSVKDAADQATNLSEAEDMKAFRANQAKQSSQAGQSDLASKLQAALASNKDS